METLERRREQQVSGLEKLLRWVLMGMLTAVFVTRFLPDLVQQVSSLSVTVSSAFLVQTGFALLLVVTVVALLTEQPVAFLLLYINVLVAILVMGISLIPGVVLLLPVELATEATIAANLVVLLLGVSCHWLQKNRVFTDLT